MRGVNCGAPPYPGGYDWYPCQHERFIQQENGQWVNNVTYCGGRKDVCQTDIIVTVANVSLPAPGVVHHEANSEISTKSSWNIYLLCHSLSRMSRPLHQTSSAVDMVDLAAVHRRPAISPVGGLAARVLAPPGLRPHALVNITNINGSIRLFWFGRRKSYLFSLMKLSNLTETCSGCKCFTNVPSQEKTFVYYILFIYGWCHEPITWPSLCIFVYRLCNTIPVDRLTSIAQPGLKPSLAVPYFYTTPQPQSTTSTCQQGLKDNLWPYYIYQSYSNW